jgi:heme exporter protein A
MEMLLSVQDLCVARSGQVLLAGVSFELAAGQALILKGPNGLGKTTLLRTIAGLQPALSGQIRAKEDSFAYAAHADGVKPSLTVKENLQFWADIFDYNDIDAALSVFDLGDLKLRMAGLLSAGQKRRLGLARMMISNRPVWVLDEPSVSLDAASIRQLEEVIKFHLQNGGAALIVTHGHLELGSSCQILHLDDYKSNMALYDAAAEAFL